MTCITHSDLQSILNRLQEQREIIPSKQPESPTVNQSYHGTVDLANLHAVMIAIHQFICNLIWRIKEIINCKVLEGQDSKKYWIIDVLSVH